MKVTDAIRQRKSVRAFLNREVDRVIIEQLLQAARHAPSGTNTQPWQVAVVSGETKRELAHRLEQAFRDGTERSMDYRYYPARWNEPYNSRRRACGLQMYQTLGIKREERQRKIDQWAANYRAFDAPVMLLFFIDPQLETGSFFDYGMFVQSIMLLAVEVGLASCPQASLAEYPDIVKSLLGYPQESILICGMALGYEDSEAPINSYRAPREEMTQFSQFFD